MGNLILRPQDQEEQNLESEKEIRNKKSLNRRFGFLLIIAIVLFGLIVFEIISHFI